MLTRAGHKRYINVGRASVVALRAPAPPEVLFFYSCSAVAAAMREIVHLQAGQCGNQIGAKVGG